ncbi:MAG: cytochrome c [Candidatus Korobacteraceae bacterium]
MRGFITGVLLTVAVILGGTYQYLHLGKFPVGADNPPGTIERWLADMAMEEYIDRNMPKQGNPMQPNAQNLAAGARLYEQNCSYCHGGLLQRVSPMRTKFNPPVPQIINQIPGDPDAHLFWAIKHGIRLSGMSSWAGILSDDQIWQVTAFVKHSANLPPEAQEAWRQAAAPATANSAPPPTAPPAPASQPKP